MSIYNGNYVTTADIRLEGLSAAVATDDAVAAAIKASERFIESKCNRWFYKRTGYTMTLDGGDKYILLFEFTETTDTLSIPVPIINLTSVSINSIAMDLNDFIVMNRIGPPKDDRWNPRIISKLSFWPTQGIQNIVIVGDFGFVEDTAGTVPELIKIAARKLVFRFLTIYKMISSQRDASLNSDYITHEIIPGYEFEYGKSWDSLNRDYSGDSEIDDIIEQYRYKQFVVAV